MKADALNVYDLFMGKERRNPVYNIPHYQRGYAWKKEQVQELIEDIQEALNSEAPRYFIGAITTVDLPDDEFGQPNYEVIDGQQRITTLLLVAHALENRIPQPDTRNDEKDVIRGKLKNLVGYTDRGSPPVYHARHDDRESLENIRSNQTSGTGPHRIYDAFRIINEKLDQMSDDEIIGFSNYLLNNTMMVVINTDDEESSYQIFETLNNRGESLTALDLIRNRIFKTISGDSNRLDSAHTLWSDRLTRIQEHTDKRTADTAMQQLFVVQLDIKEKRWIETKELYDAIKNTLENMSSAAAYDLLREIISEDALRSWIQIYKSNGAILESRPYKEEVKAAREYRVFHPPLFIMLLRNGNPTAIKRTSSMLYHYIRRVTLATGRIPVKKLGTRMAELAAHLKELPSLSSSEQWINDVANALRDVDSETAGVFTDDEFKDMVKRKPVIDPAHAKRAFIDLVNSRAESDGERLSPSETLHLEHILPQSPNFDEWEGFTPENHANYVNRLGNLTILGSRLNQSISNGPYDRKKREFSNSNYWVTNEIPDKYDTWSIESIERRGQELLDKLATLWSLA